MRPSVPLVVAVGLALAGCEDMRRLDEAVFYESPTVTLKLVHYRRNLPLHYVGDGYQVMCRSAATRERPGGPRQDAGWRALGSVPHDNEGLPASALVRRARERYAVIAPDIVRWSSTVLNVTWDACGHVAQWDPTRLPAHLIRSVDKPAHCRPRGSGDCRYYDFQGDRQPVYAVDALDRAGALSFQARSPALRGAMAVSTRSFGRVWHVVVRPPGPATTRVPLDRIHRAEARLIDPQAPAMPLLDWFEAALPPQAGPMVVWSAGLVDCGVQDGRVVVDSAPVCIEIFVTNKWNDEIYLSLWHAPVGLRWHFGQLRRDGSLRALQRLGEVPPALLRP